MKTDEKNPVLGGTLYLVGTPIGNLSDISERARKVLSEADFIAAEDTRVTGKLLACLGIHASLVSYFEHNRAERGEEIVRRLLNGESCALVTDAGMPAVSDPGQDLVRLCAENSIPVTAVPGPCAAITAFALSGLNADKFFFEGFLPRGGKERKERLALLSVIPATLIIYEAPHRIKDTLTDLSNTFGARSCAVCRELTKLNEEIIRTDLCRAAELYNGAEPRGEYVIVISGADSTAILHRSEKENDLLELDPIEHVTYYEKQGKKRMDAIKAAAADRGMTKSELYRILTERKENEQNT